ALRATEPLETVQDTVAPADRALSRGGLYQKPLDDAVINDKRKALASNAHAETRRIEFQAQRLGVGRVAVRKHENLAFRAAAFAPCIHDENIVYRHTCQGIDPFGLQRAGILNESWKVRPCASRSERSRN